MNSRCRCPGPKARGRIGDLPGIAPTGHSFTSGPSSTWAMIGWYSWHHCTHSQFNIFRALRRSKTRTTSPKTTKQSRSGVGVGSTGPTKQTMGRSLGGFCLKAAQNTVLVLGYCFFRDLVEVSSLNPHRNWVIT